MIKRVTDIILSILGIIILIPLIVFCFALIWLNDFHSPFYFAERSGKNGKIFRMIKFRTMTIGADKSGVASTAIDDIRITKVGHFLRKYKIDEIPNLFNILIGQMSFVGPRPNLKRETDLYTKQERNLLSIKPGVTDFASIVFSDEGNILEGSSDPDLVYNQLIRPWKSRLGLLYIENKSIFLDLKLIFATILAILSKRKALAIVVKTLQSKSSDSLLINICKRENKLKPYPPPGSKSIIMNR
tara:strand:- start:815 stop:1543 length:729 start_codon:yes stop_codon:yes gene_type:complete